MQFARRMLRFLRSPLFQIILYRMDQNNDEARGLYGTGCQERKTSLCYKMRVLLMIIWEETKTKVQTEYSWNTQNDEYPRVRTSAIRVLSGFWRKVSHFFYW